MKLFDMQEYEDERLGEHAKELLANINNEIGEPAEGELEDWEDPSDGEGDDDAEMQG